MKVLLTGSNGQVGWEVSRQAQEHGATVVATDRQSCDITHPAAIEAAVTHEIDCVINAAAYTAVDRAEEEPDAAHRVNAVAPGLLAERCESRGIPIIHISTDYVFDGSYTRPYREDDPVSPLGVYGKTKLDGEHAVRATTERHVILRTSWVFGVHGNNFVKTMLRLGADRDELRVVADQIGCPTFAGSIAAAALTIATGQSENYGTYHFCDQGPTTWQSFAVRCLQSAVNAGLIERMPGVEPIATSEYPTPARRPAYSVLDTKKFTDVFSQIPPRSWEAGISRVIDALQQQKQSEDAV